MHRLDPGPLQATIFVAVPGLQRTASRCAAPGTRNASIRVARGDLAGDLGALFQVAADGDFGGRRAGAVGLLEPAVAAVEARHHPGAAIGGLRLGVDQGLHLGAPAIGFLEAADRPQVVQGAEDFREPLQAVIQRRGRRLRLGRMARGGQANDECQAPIGPSSWPRYAPGSGSRRKPPLSLDEGNRRSDDFGEPLGGLEARKLGGRSQRTSASSSFSSGSPEINRAANGRMTKCCSTLPDASWATRSR